jgi:hypothetical protein
MDIKQKYLGEVEKQISELQDTISSIKEKYDKRIEEYSIGSIYDPKIIGKLQIGYLTEIQPYQKQIEYLVQSSTCEYIVVIPKGVGIDMEDLKKMQAPVFNCLGVPKELL